MRLDIELRKTLSESHLQWFEHQPTITIPELISIFNLALIKTNSIKFSALKLSDTNGTIYIHTNQIQIIDYLTDNYNMFFVCCSEPNERVIMLAGIDPN